jgi:hypothetical protein
MSDFEALSLVVSCLALVVSLLALNAQRRLQRESNDLQRATAELSRKQLELINKSEAEGNNATLSISLVKQGQGHRVLVRNLGPADALNIGLTSLGEALETVLVPPDELEDKCPIPRLRPSESASLIATVYLASPALFKMRASWQTETGQQFQEEFVVGQP